MKYLGHVVSREGVTADPDKIKKVATWPAPSSTKEVQSFLGFASYYRRFIQGFAEIAKPLHRLTKRGLTYQWTAECQTAFENLRQRLSSAPILAHPDFHRQFILDTDASDTGVGAVLSQMNEEGREQVIAYGSRLLSKAERRYCVTRRELLAVVTFTRHFRPYLVGQKFLLQTDHGSLTWLQNFREPEGQLARWLEQLQELEFEIVHRRGTNADPLSRMPCQQCGRESHGPTLDIPVTSLQIPQMPSGASIREEQLEDATLGPMLRGKEASQKPCMDGECVSRATRRLLQIWDQLLVSEGVLCRHFESPDGKGAVIQLLIPQKLRKEVLTDLHEGPLGGHLGVDKTLARLQERFYWPGYHDDVRNWCSTCAACAARKNPTPKARAPLTGVKTGYPLQLVAMDILGQSRGQETATSWSWRTISRGGLRHTPLGIKRRLLWRGR